MSSSVTMDRSPLVIPDEPRQELDTYNAIYPPEYKGHFSMLLITKQEILDRIKVLAEFIHEDYKNSRPVLVCVLKGANPFFENLLEALQELKQGYYTEFLRVSSYEGTSSTGVVTIRGGIQPKQFEGKNVILVEDLVDTGTTLSHLLPTLEKDASPKSIEICSLLEKRLDSTPKVKAKYIGFTIPNHFIIGYGLDYDELYRDVQDIWVISKEGIEFDRSKLPS